MEGDARQIASSADDSANSRSLSVLWRFSSEVVGATGFEPATPCAQGRCATRLRYAPTLNNLEFTAISGLRFRPCCAFSGDGPRTPPDNSEYPDSSPAAARVAGSAHVRLVRIGAVVCGAMQPARKTPRGMKSDRLDDRLARPGSTQRIRALTPRLRRS